jgi:Tol biopolymer transport system component
VWVLPVVCLVGLIGTTSSAASDESGQIVFVSSIATPPGSIDALAPGVAPHDLGPAFGAFWLAIAPHGKRIAYWGYAGSKLRLFVAHDDGSATRTLQVPRAGREYSFDRAVFSSDGSSILIAQSSFKGRAWMALVDLSTGSLRRVGGGACFDPVEWSPDGKLFACVAGNENSVVSVFDLAGRRRFKVVVPRSEQQAAVFWSGNGLLAVSTNNRGLAHSTDTTTIIDARGSPLGRVSGAAGGWSSDGRKLIVSRPTTVVAYDVASGRTTTLLRTPGKASPEVAITPDGRDVVVAYSPQRLRIVPIGAGKAYSLKVASPSDVAWSRQGRYAYTRAVRSGGVEVVVGSLSGGRAQVVGRFPFDSHGWSELEWLADGSRVLYDWSARVPNDLWSMQPDGSDQRRLTNAGEDISSPTWSPDGQRLAYASSGFNDGLCGYCSPRIVISDASADRSSQMIVGVGTGGTGEGAPSWSPAGDQLVVETDVENDLGLTIITPGQQSVALTKTGASPAWAPDGGEIAYLDSNGISVIHLPDHAEISLILGNAKHPITSIAWSPDSKVIAFTTDAGLYVTAADGSQTPHAIYGHAAYSSSFSPDGQQLVFAGAPALNGDTIYTINTDGSALRPIAVGGEPAWRPNSNPP